MSIPNPDRICTKRKRFSVHCHSGSHVRGGKLYLHVYSKLCLLQASQLLEGLRYQISVGFIVVNYLGLRPSSRQHCHQRIFSTLLTTPPLQLVLPAEYESHLLPPNSANESAPNSRDGLARTRHPSVQWPPNIMLHTCRIPKRNQDSYQQGGCHPNWQNPQL